jgi:hypothetical protein
MKSFWLQLSDRALAQHVQGPGFNPQHTHTHTQKHLRTKNWGPENLNIYHLFGKLLEEKWITLIFFTNNHMCITIQEKKKIWMLNYILFCF